MNNNTPKWLQDYKSSLKKYDYKSYLKEFDYKIFFLKLLALAIFFGLSNELYSIIDSYITPIISSFKSMIIIDLILLSITVFLVRIFIINIFREKLTPTINSIITSALILFIYLYIRHSKHYTFSSVTFTKELYYTDIILLFVILQFLEYKSYQHPLKKEKSRLIEDIPFISVEEDQYSRAEFAGSVADLINNSSTIENSFGIALIGEWGSGKTNFIHILKQKLNEHKTENEILDFNPWKVSKPEAMVDDFFTNLSTHLSKYNKSINSKIKKYSKQLFQTSKNIEHRLLDTLININESDETLELLNKAINNSILKTGKRLIVFIDDLDRLTNKEIIEVLRIIRNTGNFANTYYVVALDYNYTIGTLNDSKVISSSEEYLKKIFQLTITLPAYKKTVIIDTLKKHLGIDLLPIHEQMVLKEVIKKLSFDSEDFSSKMFPAMPPTNYIENMLNNLRDVKRFANAFNISYSILKNDVAILDLFLLELIKHSNIEVYLKLADRSLLHYDTNQRDYYILNQTEWENYSKKQNDPKRLSNTERALRLLFENSRQNTNRSFIDPQNFYLYFSYQLFDLISLNDFNALIEHSTAHSILEKFKEWKNQGKENSLKDIISVYNDLNNVTKFKKYFTALLMYSLNSNDVFFNVHTKLIREGEIYVTILFRTEPDEQKRLNLYRHEILEAILQDDSIDSFIRAKLYNIILTPYIYNNHPGSIESSFKKSDLQKKIYRLFHNFLNNHKHYDERVFEFFMLNDSHREEETLRVRLYPPALRRMRQFLQSDNRIGENFIWHFLRPVYSNRSGEYAFEPFADDIFQTKETLKGYIKNISSENHTILSLKKIILNRFDELYQDVRIYTFKATTEEDKILIPHMKMIGALPENPLPVYS